MKNSYDVVIVGAGAAGMMAAAACTHARVLLLERNEKVGRKIAITGKGRCNLTNDCTPQTFFDAVKHNPRFLYSAYRALDSQAVMAFFEMLGVPLKVERGNRVFPQSDRAFDIVDALRRAALRPNVTLRTDVRVKELLLDQGAICGVRDEAGIVYTAPCVILACGGASYPTTGSTGDGYALARQAGHTVLPARASLCGFVTSDAWTGHWPGLTLKDVAFTARAGKKTLYHDVGELLFTHTGISGPMALTLSSVLQDEPLDGVRCSIDLKCALSREQLDARILRYLAQNPKKQVRSLLENLLPRTMADMAAQLADVPPALALAQMTRVQRERIVDLLKAFPVHLQAFCPLAEAIVTRGGVCVREVAPATMQSRLVTGLYFAGELLDVDAKTGGFNLQIAFSTGYAAGRAADAAITQRKG